MRIYHFYIKSKRKIKKTEIVKNSKFTPSVNGSDICSKCDEECFYEVKKSTQ